MSTGSSDRAPRRLVVVPSDPLEAYERKGRGNLIQSYYNPRNYFDDVYVLSPKEVGARFAHGMYVIGVQPYCFRRRLAELRPSVVRAYGGYWPSDLVTSQRILDVPVVVSVHDPNPKRVHQSLRYADLVYCTSKIVIDRVKSVGVSPTRIRLLPNRIDLRLFRRTIDDEETDNLDVRFPGKYHILLIGRLSPEKNHETVIRALALLPHCYSAVFVGRGSEAPHQKLADKCGVGGRVHFVQSVPNHDLPKWYSWCDCVCIPSRWEGFGLALIEAAACGAAVVTSDISPMNEFFTPDQTAALVKEFTNPHCLAEVIRKVCEDETYGKNLRRNARKAAKPFQQDRIDKLELEYYREAMQPEEPDKRRHLEIHAWRLRNHPAILAGKHFSRHIMSRARSRLGQLKRVYPTNVKIR